jgi:hypothetical protein
MIPWYGGQEQKFISVGLQVQFTLWGELYWFLFSPTRVPVVGGGAGSNPPVGKYWPFLPVSHSSIFLRNSLRNSSSVTLRYTSRFICVVRNLFRKRRHTFGTVYNWRARWHNLFFILVHKTSKKLLKMCFHILVLSSFW